MNSILLLVGPLSQVYSVLSVVRLNSHLWRLAYAKRFYPQLSSVQREKHIAVGTLIVVCICIVLFI